jgi:hypothetical protein
MKGVHPRKWHTQARTRKEEVIKERNEGGGRDHSRGTTRETHTCPEMPWEKCEAMEREIEIEYIVCKRTKKRIWIDMDQTEIDYLSESAKVTGKQIQLKYK